MRLIEGIEYYTTAEVVSAAGVSRQTLWRWRKEGLVPQGHTFRSRGVLFSRTERDRIVAYANRVEGPRTNHEQYNFQFRHRPRP